MIFDNISDGQKMEIWRILLGKKRLDMVGEISDTFSPSNATLYSNKSVFSKKIKEQVCKMLGVSENDFNSLKITCNQSIGTNQASEQAELINSLNDYIETLRQQIELLEQKHSNFTKTVSSQKDEIHE